MTSSRFRPERRTCSGASGAPRRRTGRSRPRWRRRDDTDGEDERTTPQGGSSPRRCTTAISLGYCAPMPLSQGASVVQGYLGPPTSKVAGTFFVLCPPRIRDPPKLRSCLSPAAPFRSKLPMLTHPWESAAPGDAR
jgi:hypothetical protein